MKRILLAALVLSACSRGVSVGTDKSPSATANILDLNGKTVGVATFQQSAVGVAVDVKATNLPAGSHGLHIHPIGNCDPANGYAAAGSHMNPDNKQHGLNNPAGPHAGDLPNLDIDASGKGHLRTVDNRFTVEQLLDADGSSILIHANKDDYMTQPSGGSGAKIACGVIHK